MAGDLSAAGLTTDCLAAAFEGDGSEPWRAAALDSCLMARVRVRVCLGGGAVQGAAALLAGLGALGWGGRRLGGGLTGRLESSFRDLDLGLRLTGSGTTRLLQG